MKRKIIPFNSKLKDTYSARETIDKSDRRRRCISA
jgi:hypothetical protein